MDGWDDHSIAFLRSACFCILLQSTVVHITSPKSMPPPKIITSNLYICKIMLQGEV